ncbi:MAG: sensor histidine kinase [Gemmatimonadaceae bacterium]
MSLRLRLAIWYAGLSLLVVAVACVYSYAVHNRTHYDELDRMIHETANHLAFELAEDPRARDSILARPVGAGVSLLNERGELLFQSAEASRAPAIDISVMTRSANRPAFARVARIAPAMHVPSPGQGWFGLLVRPSGERHRIFVSRAPGGTYLALTTPLLHIDQSMRAFGLLMFWIAGVGGIVAFAVGWAVAGRALRPVAALTESAETIAKSREFSRRVPESSSRDELGRLSRTFNTMLANLESAYDSEVRFVSAASHELRTPLTVVQANLDLLQLGDLSEDDQMISLSEASRESERMARLVADLLVLARADAGVPIRREYVEIDRVVLDVLNETRHLATGKRVDVRHIEPGVVRGDPDRLKQLMLNVIENAIKYSDEGGHVAVGIRRLPDGIEISVRDDGIGILPEDLPRVYNRFFRGEAARERDSGGSGLGLAIASWIVSQHGGTISVDSSVGRGTTVRVSLPEAPAGKSSDSG